MMWKLINKFAKYYSSSGVMKDNVKKKKKKSENTGLKEAGGKTSLIFPYTMHAIY